MSRNCVQTREVLCLNKLSCVACVLCFWRLSQGSRIPWAHHRLEDLKSKRPVLFVSSVMFC